MNNILPLLLVLLLSGDNQENNTMLALCLVLLLGNDNGANGNSDNNTCTF